MSLQAQQTFLARLFIDERLRQSFLQDPDNIGSENGLDKTDIAQLKDILPHELDMFSNSLFYKRASEVEKILPLTCGVLGSDFRKSFREFSLTFATKSIKKHLEDAVQFVNYLQEQKPKDIW